MAFDVVVVVVVAVVVTEAGSAGTSLIQPAFGGPTGAATGRSGGVRFVKPAVGTVAGSFQRSLLATVTVGGVCGTTTAVGGVGVAMGVVTLAV